MNRSRRDSAVSFSSIDAAALQSEMVKRFGLKPGKKRVSRSAPQTHPPRCLSCNINMGENFQEYCEQCGYGMPPTITCNEIESSLAFRRGLIKPVEKRGVDVMMPFDWYLIESQLVKKVNPDTSCPICMEIFNRGEEVLLSCGHIFHKVCLRSFENFMKTAELSCPICRAKNYQKKLTNLGHIFLQKVSITKIQTVCRGYLARKGFKRQLRRYYRSGAGNETRRAAFFQNEFSAMSRRMDKTMNDRGHQLDTILRSVDRTLEDSRQLDQLFEQMLLQRQHDQSSSNMNSQHSPAAALSSGSQLKDAKTGMIEYCATEVCSATATPWAMIYHQAESRGMSDCAICMLSITLQDRKKQNVLLSCSHLFHFQCLTSFEKFTVTLIKVIIPYFLFSSKLLYSLLTLCICVSRVAPCAEASTMRRELWPLHLALSK